MPEVTTQDDLLSEALKAPGVKEAAEVYGRVAPRIPPLPQFTTVVSSYATGGNAGQ